MNTLRQAAQEYLTMRRSLGYKLQEGRPVSSYLFVSNWGNRLDGGDIRRTFYALSRQIGLRGPSDSRGPRLHVCGMGSLRRHYWGGTAQARMPSSACRSCPPTSGTSTGAIPIGI